MATRTALPPLTKAVAVLLLAVALAAVASSGGLGWLRRPDLLRPLYLEVLLLLSVPTEPRNHRGDRSLGFLGVFVELGVVVAVAAAALGITAHFVLEAVAVLLLAV